jgi:hypothetical protein
LEKKSAKFSETVQILCQPALFNAPAADASLCQNRFPGLKTRFKTRILWYTTKQAQFFPGKNFFKFSGTFFVPLRLWYTVPPRRPFKKLSARRTHMKKITSLALALALALTLTACGKKDNTAGSGDSSVPADATALLTAVWDAHSDDEKFPAAGGDYENPVEDAPGAVSIADADNLNYMLTLPVEDAGKIDGAASLSHMMNANTFTCGAFHVTSKDDVETVASDLRDAIQSKQWMCGFPDKLVIFTYDQYVVSLYGDEELVNTFRDKFTATYSDSTIAYDEAIL